MTTAPATIPMSIRWSVVTAVVGCVAFVALAAFLVPWDPIPGTDPSPVSPDTVFSPAEITRAEDFRGGVRPWAWASLAVSLAVACWLGFSRRGRVLADRTRGPWWLRVLTAVAALVLIGRFATLGFAMAVRQRYLDVGLSTSSWPAWTVDVALATAIEVGVTALAVLVLVGSARRWRRAWPAVAGPVLAALVVLGSFVYPVLVEPLFNDFASLPEGELRTEILALAEAEGVAVDDVLVADASRRTTTLNAYVSGFAGTRRVVVYDNLVEDASVAEAVSVVAHELAHARHRDVVVGTALGASGVVAGVGLLGLALGALRRTGCPPLPDVRAVPAVLAMVAVAGVVVAPVQNGISRRVETRADVVALEVTGDREGGADAFVAMQRRLALRSLADPTPPSWSQWWFGSHPTVLERVALARTWPDAQQQVIGLSRRPTPR